MTCANYKQKRSFIDSNDCTKYVVYAELYSTNDPLTLPTNAVGITGFPQNLPAQDVVFEPSSYIYSVATGKIYLADESGTFVLQS